MVQRFYFFLIFILLLGSSCARYKNITYIQDRYEVTDSTKHHISVAEGGDLELRIGDNVYINVYGLEFNQLESFNKEAAGGSSNFNELSLYLKGYFINDTGEVELPVLGKIKLAGLTLYEAKDHLQAKVDEYLVGAVVDIRLLSYQITVLGEVKQPGKFDFYKREINILDVLAQAGDLDTYGDARNLILIREKDGVSETYNFDLTSSDFFSSPYFWLKPNDVIYVKPLHSKMVSVNSPAISVILSGLTTMLLLLTYINF
jgi:polysaccharide export outer membrane protein